MITGGHNIPVLCMSRLIVPWNSENFKLQR